MYFKYSTLQRNSGFKKLGEGIALIIGGWLGKGEGLHAGT